MDENGEPKIRKRIFGAQTTKLGSIATKASLRLKKFMKRTKDAPSPQTIADNTVQDTKATLSDKGKAEREHKIEKIVAESNEILYKARTVFPFTLFPDEIIVDRLKVTITRNNFFFSEEVTSIRVEDLLNIKSATGPFFGSLILTTRVLTEEQYPITTLWRHDAIHLKHIIQGYIIAHHNKVDCTHLTKDELVKTLVQLGQDSNS